MKVFCTDAGESPCKAVGSGFRGAASIFSSNSKVSVRQLVEEHLDTRGVFPRFEIFDQRIVNLFPAGRERGSLLPLKAYDLLEVRKKTFPVIFAPQALPCKLCPARPLLPVRLRAPPVSWLRGRSFFSIHADSQLHRTAVDRGFPRLRPWQAFLRTRGPLRACEEGR